MDMSTVIRKRFTAEEYEQIAAAGILGEDERFELLEGEIVAMSPLGPQHSATVTRLTELFMRWNFRYNDLGRKIRYALVIIRPHSLMLWSRQST